MRTVIRHHFGKKKPFTASLKQRSVALFFCLLFVGTMVLPSLSIYVAAMADKHEYAGALDAAATNVPVAADSADGTATSDNPLYADGPENSEPGSQHEEIIAKRTENSETFDLGGGQLEVRNSPKGKPLVPLV